MTTQIETNLSRLVMNAFSGRRQNDISMLKDFCLLHFSKELNELQKKMTHSKSHSYEKEMLLVSDEIEIIASGWLPGNRCYPHDQGQAESFVFVLNGKVENTLFDFEDAALQVIDRSTKTAGQNLYIGEGTIHQMQNNGTENLICLHVYIPGIGEMQIFDEQQQTVYTVSSEARAWLPAKEDHILEVKSYAEAEMDGVRKIVGIY